jgi:chromosome segregation ATPase
VKQTRMKTSVIVALGLMLLVSNTFAESIFAATNSKQMGIFAELEEIDSMDFGKKLLDTITLQLNNKSPLGDISKLLADIRGELLKQQDKADAQEARAEHACKKGIRKYNKRIDHDTNEINEAIVAIANYRRQIASLKAQKETFESQLKILANRETQFRAARKKDEEDFAGRLAQQRAVVAALNQITPELENLKPHGNVQAALVELAKIGKSNPIGALLQVAMTLDPGALQRVIQHLNKLKESVAASIQDDIKAEEDAKRNYGKMLAEFNDQRTNINNALTQTKQELETAKNNLQNQERRLANNQKDLEIAQKGKKQLIQQCDERKARYNAEKASRSKEIKVVEKILHIIASRLDTMQGYIKNRVNK